MTASARLQQLCDQAIQLHRAGDLAGAERLYRQVLVSNPRSFTPCHLLGVLRAQQGRREEAVALIGTALAIDPQAAPAWLNHANTLSDMGRYAQAIDSYGRALALRPGDVETLHNRARALLEIGWLEMALADYDQVLISKSEDLSVWNDRGAIFWSLGRDAEARACYEKVLAREPRNLEALNNMGNVLRGQRQFDQALVQYDKALAIDPDLAETLNNRGVTLSELGRFAEALACLERALALKPSLAEVWNNHGDALRALRRHDAALASFGRALVLSPDYPAALNNRGKLLCEMDRIAEGFESFSQAAALVYGEKDEVSSGLPGLSPHDVGQRSYLAGLGEDAGKGLYLSGGARLQGTALRAESWAGEVMSQWQTRAPQLVVIDEFLEREALAALRRFCWGSTIWRRIYDGGYLGAFPESGFACPLLAQIAEELRGALPEILLGHPLRYLWAFKYDSRGGGTHVHADEAAVNVNFWITPDDANRDAACGGLMVWDVAAPADWDFARFNADAEASRTFLARNCAKPTRIPYRANRAVIFDSNLFHQTDRFDFAPGYLDRRINITLLYGRR